MIVLECGARTIVDVRPFVVANHPHIGPYTRKAAADQYVGQWGVHGWRRSPARGTWGGPGILRPRIQ